MMKLDDDVWRVCQKIIMLKDKEGGRDEHVHCKLFIMFKLQPTHLLIYFTEQDGRILAPKEKCLIKKHCLFYFFLFQIFKLPSNLQRLQHKTVLTNSRRYCLLRVPFQLKKSFTLFGPHFRPFVFTVVTLVTFISNHCTIDKNPPTHPFFKVAQSQKN